MRKRSIFLVAFAVVATAGAASMPRQSPSALDRALASVRNAREHRAAEYQGRQIVYHPNYISRIEVASAGGARTEIYRQKYGYRGAKATELALNFRDAALAVFDPQGQILTLSVQTKDGETWNWTETGNPCPPICAVDSDSASPVIQLPSAGAAVRVDPNATAAERALASVGNGREHQVADRLGRKALYHPGYISRIEVVNAQGARQELYRQTKGYRGTKPTELALTFRDAALAVFDPRGQILTLRVQMKDGETWNWTEAGIPCPPFCNGVDPLSPDMQPPPR
ncbi:MAG: hypothetical protein JO040_01430 [Gemmatimonadetes bacterium]|nr:hypothetical protein [Gemmatimonadota bacterium]